MSKFPFIKSGQTIPGRYPWANMNTPAKSIVPPHARQQAFYSGLMGLGAGLSNAGRTVVGIQGLNSLPGRGAAYQAFNANMKGHMDSERQKALQMQQLQMQQAAAQRAQTTSNQQSAMHPGAMQAQKYQLAAAKRKQEIQNEITAGMAKDPNFLNTPQGQGLVDALNPQMAHTRAAANAAAGYQAAAHYRSEAAAKYAAAAAARAAEAHKWKSQAAKEKAEADRYKGNAMYSNADQAKAGMMANRMQVAADTLEGVDHLGADKMEAVKGLNNMTASLGWQRLEKGKAAFIDAYLRRVSGATIKDDEYLRAEREFFPVVGDDPQMIEYKRRSRVSAQKAMARAAGSKFKYEAVTPIKPAMTDASGKGGGGIGAAAKKTQAGWDIKVKK